jgi:hypothetical protein
MHNDTVVATLQIDSLGKTKFTTSSLPAGVHTFVANYGGNTIFAPQTSNEVTIEVKKNETSLVEIIEQQKIWIVTSGGNKYLKGVQPGDEVAIFNTSGQLISSFSSISDCHEIKGQGLTLIKIKSENSYSLLKGVL